MKIKNNLNSQKDLASKEIFSIEGVGKQLTEMGKILNEYYLDNFKTLRPDTSQQINSFDSNDFQVLKKHYHEYAGFFISNFNNDKLDNHVTRFFKSSFRDFSFNSRQWKDLFISYTGGLPNELMTRFIEGAHFELSEFLVEVTQDEKLIRSYFEDFFTLRESQQLAYEFFTMHKTRVNRALEHILSFANAHNIKLQNHNKHTLTKALSAFTIALRHFYLDKAKIEPTGLNGNQVGELYGHLANSKNIQKAYNDIYFKRKSANKTQLANVKNSLAEYPEIQKAIDNDIDNLQ